MLSSSAPMENLRKLRRDEPLAVELTAVLKQGDVGRLAQLLAAHHALACSVVEDAKGGRRSPLHLFADWPGHGQPLPALRMHKQSECRHERRENHHVRGL